MKCKDCPYYILSKHKIGKEEKESYLLKEVNYLREKLGKYRLENKKLQEKINNFTQGDFI